jgi:hypothetical protein
MAAVALDLNQVLIRGFAAMIAAKFLIALDRTITHLMFAFSFVCHIRLRY